MDKLWPTLIIVAIVIVVFGAMWWGWRRRSRRDSALQPTQEIPRELGTIHLETDLFYVATTEHGQPLERLAIRGLSFRGRAHVTVADAGIAIGVSGEPDVFIPADVIDSVATATVTIDRVVEPDGLVRLSWHINTAAGPGSGPVVDSYLRAIEPDDRATLLAAVNIISQGENPNPTDIHNTTEGEV
ncbi:MAG TPA: hypothetical protein VN045_12805 [Microbacteriaceae bacterium]|jgi:hypothetical protein|nr:hypothetical protein [Microbacteriaceae bacterium]